MGTKQAKLAMECTFFPTFHLAYAGFYPLARGSPVAFCFQSNDMFSSESATDAQWDPFFGGSELRRLVCGAAFSILEHDRLGTPPLDPASPKPSRKLMHLPKQRCGDKSGHFRDFLGISEDTDPDVLTLWQLKEKYRETTQSPSRTRSSQADSDTSALAAQSVSHTKPVGDLSSSAIHNHANGSHGMQKAAVEGWEPSEGESLPLVNISFDSSILQPRGLANVISTEGSSRFNYGDSSRIPQTHRIGGLSVKRELSRSAAIANISTAVAVPSMEDGGRERTSGRPEPSRLLLSAKDPAERRIRGNVNNATVATVAPAPQTAHANRPLGRTLSFPPPPTEGQSVNVAAADAVRKLHALVPPHLAKSITTNTIKAREDESVRLRLLQQESSRLPTNTVLPGGRVDVYLTGNLETSSPQRPSSEANRRSPPSLVLAPPRESRTHSPPSVDVATTAARPVNLRQTCGHAPLAIAHQVAVPLPASRAQNRTPGAGLSDPDTISSVASQISAVYKSREHVCSSFDTGSTGTPSHRLLFDSVIKENASVDDEKHGVQLKSSVTQPLSSSSMANTQALQRSLTSEALRDLRRAWSDAGIEHLDLPAQKKPRFV